VEPTAHIGDENMKEELEYDGMIEDIGLRLIRMN